jgi:hypothetical protein
MEATTMKKSIALFLVLVLGLSLLAGCGGGGTLTGKYVSTDEESNYYEFFEDGKCVMSTNGVLSELTFKLSGKNVTIEMEYGSFKGTLEGNKLTVNEFGEDIVYEKK